MISRHIKILPCHMNQASKLRYYCHQVIVKIVQIGTVKHFVQSSPVMVICKKWGPPGCSPIRNVSAVMGEQFPSYWVAHSSAVLSESPHSIALQASFGICPPVTISRTVWPVILWSSSQTWSWSLCLVQAVLLLSSKMPRRQKSSTMLQASSGR